MAEVMTSTQSIDAGRNIVIEDMGHLMHLLENLPDDELMHCVIPLHLIHQPDLMPTDYETLAQIKSGIISAWDTPGTVNGIRDAVWLVYVNGKLLIANGYHRYEALNQLARDEKVFTPYLFVRIEKGDPDKLWRMMLEGAGGHRTVAPARFVRFMQCYWNQTDIGRQVSLADAISYIGQDTSKLRRLSDDVDRLIEARGRAEVAINVLRLTVGDALRYVNLGNLSIELIDKVRVRASIDRGEIPITVAEALISVVRLIARPDLQVHIIRRMLDEPWTARQTKELIAALSDHRGNFEQFIDEYEPPTRDSGPKKKYPNSGGAGNSSLGVSVSPGAGAQTHGSGALALHEDPMTEAWHGFEHMIRVIQEKLVLQRKYLATYLRERARDMALDNPNQLGSNIDRFIGAFDAISANISLILLRDNLSYSEEGVEQLVRTLGPKLLKVIDDPVAVQELVDEYNVSSVVERLKILQGSRGMSKVSQGLVSADMRDLLTIDLVRMQEELSRLASSLRQIWLQTQDSRSSVQSVETQVQIRWLIKFIHKLCEEKGIGFEELVVLLSGFRISDEHMAQILEYFE